tara:strand:- start:217 stop:837 length:621 start_codon:yes stop_codon:yes gene_type:complete
MSEYHFIGGDNKPYGPYSANQIKRLMAENRLNANTSVKTTGGEWKPASAYPELVASSDPVPGQPQRAVNLQAVQQMVSGPATFMMVLSIITLVVILLALIAILVGGSAAGIFGNLPPEAQAELAIEGVANIIQYTLALISNTAILIGAIKMKNMRSYSWAMAASILCILSGCGCCCPLGPGAGIWAIVVLSKPEVKAAFDQTKSMA